MNSQTWKSDLDNKGNKSHSVESVERCIKVMSRYGFTNIVNYPDRHDEQVLRGTDIKCNFKGKHLIIDHKARSQSLGHLKMVSLELQNNQGRKGSLFLGFTNVFILEDDEYFSFYSVKDLKNLFLSKVDITIPSISSKEAKVNGIPPLYTLLDRREYKQNGKPNNDRIAWFLYSDVKPLRKFTIPLT
jgi:hypothetical protein